MIHLRFYVYPKNGGNSRFRRGHFSVSNRYVQFGTQLRITRNPWRDPQLHHNIFQIARQQKDCPIFAYCNKKWRQQKGYLIFAYCNKTWSQQVGCLICSILPILRMKEKKIPVSALGSAETGIFFSFHSNNYICCKCNSLRSTYEIAIFRI